MCDRASAACTAEHTHEPQASSRLVVPTLPSVPSPESCRARWVCTLGVHAAESCSEWCAGFQPEAGTRVSLRCPKVGIGAEPRRLCEPGTAWWIRCAVGKSEAAVPSAGVCSCSFTTWKVNKMSSVTTNSFHPCAEPRP